MKNFLLLFLSTFLVSFLPNKSTESFQRDFDRIVRDFSANIKDEYECKRQLNNASRLSEEIEDYLSQEERSNEKSNLKKLKAQTDSLKDYIGVVGDCSNGFVSIESFITINKIIGGSLIITKNNFCVEFLILEIKDYKILLAKNNTSKGKSVSYTYSIKKPNGSSKGSGLFGIAPYSLKKVRSNREGSIVSIFNKVTCTDFEFN
jgi:hypothetical protein